MKGLDRLGTVVLVTLVTVVIWVFAESESLTSRSVRVEAAFEQAAGADRSLEVIDPAWRDRVDVVIEGPTGAVAEAETALRRPLRLRPGGPGVPGEPGEQVVDLANAVRGLADLQGKPVTVVRADPATVRVRIDQLVSRELKVVVEAPGAELDGAPEAKPATVRVLLPASDARSLDGSEVAVARVSPDTLTRLVPGRREAVSNVALEIPWAGAKATLTPARVEVGLTLKSRTATYTLASVPVYIMVAAVEYQRWDVSVAPEDRFLTDVQVSGPSDLVDQVRRGEIAVTAKVELSFDELERRIGSKEVIFSQLPTALTFKAETLRVRLSIRRRDGGA